jgi:hypothetical protein
MKSCNRNNPATAAAWWLSHVVVPAKAIHYGRAAERDERNGFPYTAAMEWRNAAQLFAAETRAAEYCWRRWERIMHLPRRLAEPIGLSQVAVITSPVVSVSRCATAPAMNQVSLANAA